MTNPFLETKNNSSSDKVHKAMDKFAELYDFIKTEFKDGRYKSLAITDLEKSGMLLEKHINKKEASHG